MALYTAWYGMGYGMVYIWAHLRGDVAYVWISGMAGIVWDMVWQVWYGKRAYARAYAGGTRRGAPVGGRGVSCRCAVAVAEAAVAEKTAALLHLETQETGRKLDRKTETEKGVENGDQK